MSASGISEEGRQHEIELWVLLETITELEGELAQVGALQWQRSREDWAAGRRGDRGPAALARAQQDEWACTLSDEEFADLLGPKDGEDRSAPSAAMGTIGPKPRAISPQQTGWLKRNATRAGEYAL
jgi:hypothetical protein